MQRRSFPPAAPPQSLATFEAMMDQMPQATLLADCDGRLAYANSAALALLTEGDGLALRAGMLVAPPADAGDFRAALGHACHHQAPRRDTVLLRRRGAPPLLIATAPVREADGARWALILVTVSGAPGKEAGARLRQTFGLTAAEAEIALAITNGTAVRAIMADRGVSESTVRSQLKSIAAKLGCNRQSEIAVLVKTISHAGDLRAS